LLYLIKLMLWKRGGIVIDDPQSLLLLVSFAFFSLLTIGSVQHQDRTRKEFMPGYKVMGLVMSFSGLVLLIVIGGLLLILPYLPAAAQTGYDLVRFVGRPLLELFVSVLRFIFSPRSSREEPPSSSKGLSPESGMDIPSEPSWLIDVIAHLSLALSAIVALAGFGLLLWLLVRWLWSRSPGRARHRSDFGWREVLLLMRSIWRSMRRMGITLASLFHSKDKNSRFYFPALTQWGRRSGLPRHIWETPLEYGRRLQHRFPVVGLEIDTIIAVYNQDLYGGLPARGPKIEKARQAWRKIRSPMLWGRRLGNWFKPV
jgi:hypothetical protein